MPSLFRNTFAILPLHPRMDQRMEDHEEACVRSANIRIHLRGLIDIVSFPLQGPIHKPIIQQLFCFLCIHFIHMTPSLWDFL